MAAGREGRTPDATVKRLPVYQRLLDELVRAGNRTISSEQLAELAGVNASKVRRDLSFLGSFGTRGSGYDTRFLLREIDHAVGADGDWPIVIVGLGNLGRALAHSPGFSSRGFRLAGLFDISPELVGTTVNGVEVRHFDDLTEVTAGSPPAIGVITTPADAAQWVADRLLELGAGSLLSFAPRVLTVPRHVVVRYVDLSTELEVVSFYLSHRLEADLEAAGTVPQPEGTNGAGRA